MSRSSAFTAAVGVALAVGTLLVAVGAWESGVTFDEPTQVDRSNTWLEHGWYVPGSALVDGERDEDAEHANPYVYGPAFAVLAHAANVVLGHEGTGEVSTTRAAYRVRHLASALVALLAAAAVAICAWTLTGSRLFGLWSAAALLAIPGWTGHAFFNPKDIPAAVGYTLLTTGLVLALAHARRPLPTRATLWTIAGMVAAGVWLGAGTRVALLAPFVVTLAGYAALRLCQERVGGIDRHRAADLAVVGGALAGCAGIVAIYPNLLSSPLTLATELVSGSSDYPWSGVTLTAGQLLSEHPPWWYLPVWAWASLPVLIGILFVGGVLSEGRAMLEVRRRLAGGSIWRRRELGALLVLQQALMLPVAAVLLGSVIYTGMRQHIYVLPAIAVLAGVGAYRVWRWAGARERSPVLRHGSAVLLSLALVVPLAEQALLFPYNYTYVNPVAGLGGVNDRWETDYWFASAPEAISRVPAGAPLACSVSLIQPGGDPNAPVGALCGGDWVAPFIERQGTDSESSASPGETWIVARKRAANGPPAYCREADNVTRWVRGEAVVMAYVLRCPTRAASPSPPPGSD